VFVFDGAPEIKRREVQSRVESVSSLPNSMMKVCSGLAADCCAEFKETTAGETVVATRVATETNVNANANANVKPC
jgi:hypothetical protein